MNTDGTFRSGLAMLRHPSFTAASLIGFAALLGGCQSDYSADITNNTTGRVTAEIFRWEEDGAVLGAARVLGPGGRGLVGPVRADPRRGALLSINTSANPTHPVTWQLPPGESAFEIQPVGEGRDGAVRIQVKP